MTKKNEKTIETKACANCSSEFHITDKDKAFYDKVSPIFAGKKEAIPTPTFCPDCRRQRRLSFRNERKLYKRTCDLTGKAIISCYDKTSPYKVYRTEDRWGDGWDAMNFGQDFDSQRPFFDQFAELALQVPRMALLQTNNENAEYNNYCSFLKDCYLIFDSTADENCAYLYNTGQSKYAFDCTTGVNLEHCYECTDCYDSYQLFYSSNCENCRDSYFMFNCTNCSDCINCVNLTGGKYHIENMKYSPEEYERKKKEILSDIEANKKRFANLVAKDIHQDNYNKGCESCSGDYLKNCKNTEHSYDLFECQDSKYSSNANRLTDCYDYESCAGPAQLGLEMNGTMECYHNLFGIITWGSDLYYCDHVTDSKDCFGCVGIRNKQYCILNKQYSKEEYEKLVPEIIEHMRKHGEWGEFFPSNISPFGYNETLAQDYYPMTKEGAQQRGFKWMDIEYPINVPASMKTIKKDEITSIEDIKNNPDLEKEVLNTAIICTQTGKPFRVVGIELEFYKKHNLELPSLHPEVRHLDRLARRNARKVFERKCDNCGVDISTTYSPEREEKVYCQSCFRKEIYG